MEYSDKSLKSQMKRANKLGASHVLIIGEQEMQQNTATLRNMADKEQIDIPMPDLAERLIQRFQKDRDGAAVSDHRHRSSDIVG